jgi:hypothetical protein
MLLLYFVGAGVIVGWLAGGRLSALAEIQFRWWGLALGGLAFQVLLFNEPLASRVGDAGPALYVSSTVVVLAALLRNIGRIGFPVIAFGAALNLVAIVSNGGLMPADPLAFAALSGEPVVPTTAFSNSSLIGPHTLFPFLGDTLVLPHPFPFANVFSMGDVAIGTGAVIFLVAAMKGRAAPIRARNGASRPAAAAHGMSPRVVGVDGR